MPLIMWSISLVPFINSAAFAADGPEVAFTAFALVCLSTSVLWHTMAGCADPVGMEFCARIDYVGIGWYVEPIRFFTVTSLTILCITPLRRLISASVGTVVYYGFQCYPQIGRIFLVCCLLTGIAGNIFPFMDWFNTYEYRVSQNFHKNERISWLTFSLHCRCGA